MGTSKYGQFWIDDIVACCIREEALRMNVPEYIAMGIAGAESGWDPNALGDNGESYGLFQLNVAGGQGTEYRENADLLFNPRLNSRIAMVPIAGAVYGCMILNRQGMGLVTCVAVHSGHPGHVSESDARVQHILAVTLNLIFDRSGNFAHWPDLIHHVCADVRIPGIPPPAPAPPMPG